MVKKSKNRRFSLAKITLVSVLVLQSLALVVLVWYALVARAQLDMLSGVKFGQLVVDTIDSITKDVPIDARTGEAYIHEAKLRLPAASDPHLKLKYNYLPPSDGFPAQVQLASSKNVALARQRVFSGQNHTAVFDSIPHLQACFRGYHITFEENSDSSIQKVFEKRLQDGRTLYAYKEDLCKDNHELLVEYLRQIDSY